MAKHKVSQVAGQFSRYLDSYAKRLAPGLTDQQADVVDNEGSRIIKRLANMPSQSGSDVILKVRAAMQEGVECIQANWLFASIDRDLKRFSAR
jgi:hypothetical protein